MEALTYDITVVPADDSEATDGEITAELTIRESIDFSSATKYWSEGAKVIPFPYMRSTTQRSWSEDGVGHNKIPVKLSLKYQGDAASIGDVKVQLDLTGGKILIGGSEATGEIKGVYKLAKGKTFEEYIYIKPDTLLTRSVKYEMTVIAGSKKFKPVTGALKIPSLESVNEFIMQERILEFIEANDLREDGWNKFSTGEKEDFIELMAKGASTIMGVQLEGGVRFESIEGTTFGQYNFGGNFLRINPDRFSVSYEKMANTVIHELRHAYQDAAIENPAYYKERFALSQSRIDAWKKNMSNNYKTKAKNGENEYSRQPVENDAFSFADSLFMP